MAVVCIKLSFSLKTCANNNNSNNVLYCIKVKYKSIIYLYVLQLIVHNEW
jgi:hypothetical protein